ncbi:MAG: polyhydroxyalkanoate depolymerase [Pseudomonadota bacterium]|nr:polyhydroxyalkanoate depolymerase [Pseudomonadota bacterium]
MLYNLFELNRAAAAPINAAAGFGQFLWTHPTNPLAHTYWGRSVAASMEMVERSTRRFARQLFGISMPGSNGEPSPVLEEVVWQKPFCRLLHFAKPGKAAADEPKFLLVAPMSGHHSTLLRGTVEAMLPHGDIYLTDWADAREVPLGDGAFDLDDYIDYLFAMLAQLGADLHVVAVCQPSVPVLAAVALMSARQDANVPRSMILMGGPIDTRRSPTAVNRYAEERGADWFRRHAIVKVPFLYPGSKREVYPGFLQLTGFVAMNFERHVNAHRDLYWNLVEGNDRADKHKEFYNEYLSVMDLTADFYLQTVERVFVGKDLALGRFRYRGERADPSAIVKTALMTIEGERDDISGTGQTEAAHELCTAIPAERRRHHLQKEVGHYGVFSGSRFQTETLPRMLEFVAGLSPVAARRKPAILRKVG